MSDLDSDPGQLAAADTSPGGGDPTNVPDPAGGLPAGGDQGLPADVQLTPGQAKALQAEAARYRTENQPFKQAFDGYGDEERQALLDFVAATRDNPRAAAQFAQEYAQAVLAEQQQQQQQAEQPLTMAQFQQLMQQRDQQEQTRMQEFQVQRQVGEINRSIQELGYKPNAQWNEAEWHDAADAMAVLGVATYITNGDIQRAHELMQSRGQQAIGDFVAGRQQDARNNPLPVGGRGAPPASNPQLDGLTGWDKANAQVRAMLGG